LLPFELEKIAKMRGTLSIDRAKSLAAEIIAILHHRMLLRLPFLADWPLDSQAYASSKNQ